MARDFYSDYLDQWGNFPPCVYHFWQSIFSACREQDQGEADETGNIILYISQFDILVTVNIP